MFAAYLNLFIFQQVLTPPEPTNASHKTISANM